MDENNTFFLLTAVEAKKGFRGVRSRLKGKIYIYIDITNKQLTSTDPREVILELEINRF